MCVDTHICIIFEYSICIHICLHNVFCLLYIYLFYLEFWNKVRPQLPILARCCQAYRLQTLGSKALRPSKFRVPIVETEGAQLCFAKHVV